MSGKKKIVLLQAICLVLLVSTVYTAFGFIRLATNSGAFLSWQLPPSNQIEYVININGSDNISDESEDVAIRLGFQAWTNVQGSRVTFIEDPANRNLNSTGDQGSHIVLFDENNSSGFFTGAGIVAITPVLFNEGTGQIVDADIVFNGRDHNFSTDNKAGTYDVQSIVTHEIGHLLGLDHSAVKLSSMFPFTQANQLHMRSLTTDDAAGAATIYPSGGGNNNFVNGHVFKSGTAQKGAHVVAVDNNTGKTLSAAVTNASGYFNITGLPNVTVRVYAEPLDGPVTPSEIKLTSVNTNFKTTHYGSNGTPSTFAVNQGIGTLSVPAAGGGFNLNLTETNKLRVVAGTNYTGSNSLRFRCTDFNRNQDNITFSNSGITVTSAYTSLGSNWYSCEISVANTVPNGIYNLRATKANSDISILTGGIEVVAPAPTITNITPNTGPVGGNQSITINGTNFQANSTITMGGRVASVSALSANSITVVTPGGDAPNTSVDVVVNCPDGQIVKSANGYTYEPNSPIISSITPNEGATSGSTQITINGQYFTAGLTVTIGGKTAVVNSFSQSKIICTTPPNYNTPGAVNVVVTNPGPKVGTATNGFTYITPVLNSISPAVGNVNGGTLVTITGKGFDPLGRVNVQIGANSATSISVVNGQTITCTTQSGTAGPVNVTVTNTPDNEGVTQNGIYTYVNTPDPKVNSISPTSGPDSGGTEITITGENFDGGATVQIGNANANILSKNSTTIVVTAPAQSAGTYAVHVTNGTMQKGSLLSGYLYLATSTNNVSTNNASGGGGGGGGGGGCSLVSGQQNPWDAAGSMIPFLLLAGLILVARRRSQLLG